jgi:hypothetical protein
MSMLHAGLKHPVLDAERDHFDIVWKFVNE